MNLRAFALPLVGLALGVSGAAFGLVHAAKGHAALSPSGAVVPAVEKGEGIVSKPSNHSVDETVAKLKSMLQAKGHAALSPSGAVVPAVEKGEGIVSKPSNHSVDETVAKLKSMLQAKGVKLFIVIDHSGEAAKAGLKMPNTKLLIFGNPKGGTPLMLAAPSVAIDLPLKILVAEDGQGKVWISYNSPEYLKERHGLPEDLMKNIAVVGVLAEKAGE
jgi:uncharacterized protein (DUF302 family)